ncbi:histidine kinase [Glaciimonas sp. GG7]
MEQSISRNHLLSQQLISLQEAERKSLARDLHDEFGQCLTAIHTDASVVLKHAEKKYPELLGSAVAITKMSRHLMDLVTGMRHRLRPGILDEMGLAAALEEQIETWKSGHHTMQCSFHLDYDPEGFDETAEVTVYRMVQECLTNISRHAAARRVHIQMIGQLRGTKPGLLISVTDDGKGFEENNVEGLGLAGMRERFAGLGGEFLLTTLPGQGTHIQAWIPSKGAL